VPAILERSDTVIADGADGADVPAFDTVVVGGGIAGLTAALSLKNSGKRVLLLEAADRVGGAISTLREDGYLVERGPNTVLDTHVEVADLIEKAGISDERIYASDDASNRFIVRDGRLAELPLSPGAFLKTELFSRGAKFRLAAEPFIGRADAAREESVAEFTTRRLGQEFLDYAIDPFVSGVYAGRPDALSVRHAFPRLREVEERYGSLILGQIRGARERKRRSDAPKTAARMFSFEGGLDRLPRAIRDTLGGSVKTGARVTSIVHGEPVWLVRYCNEGGDEGGDERGAVHVASALSIVYAAGLQNVDLLKPLAGDISAADGVYYPPLSVVGLGFRDEDVRHPLNGFGLLVPSREQRFILGALFSSSLFPGRAPKNHVLVTAFVGGARSPEKAALNDQRLISAIMGDLRELLGLTGSPLWYDITRWEKAIPQYNVGYGAVKEALERFEGSHPGFVFAGNYLSGISVAESIKSGHAASSKAVEFLNSSENKSELKPERVTR